MKKKKKETINHPPHYSSGGIEHIDIVDAFGLDYYLGNSTKYILRAGRKSKNMIEDLEKARWYLTRKISILRERKK